VRILVVNPNRLDGCTDGIRRAAESVAAPGTEIVAVQPEFGPVELAGQREVLLSAVGVLDCVARHGPGAAAVVLAGFGEPGREAVQETVDVPVLDITECAPAVAGLLGRSYTVVTSTRQAVPVVEDRLRALGLLGRCAGIVPVGLGVAEMLERPEETRETVVEAAKRAEGDVVVLGCGGMAGMGRSVRVTTGLPVVDGVTAAVALAESLVRLD